MFAIINGRVLTGTGLTYENGTIIINDGKIIEIGEHVDIPEEAEVFDAKGYWVTPGFIDAHTHIGTRNEPQYRGATLDHSEIGDPLVPHMSLVDAFNPDDIGVKAAREAGFTTCCTLPGAKNVIGGTGFSFKTAPKNITEHMMIPGTSVMKFAFGENPIMTYGNLKKTPNTRMGIATMLRNVLSDARRYSDQLLAAEKGSQISGLKHDIKLDALVPVVRGEMLCRIHCHTSYDIATAIRIAKEFNMKYSLEHATEGFKITDVIAKEGVTCVVGPLVSELSKREIWERNLYTPGIMDRAGIPICLTQDAGIMTKMLPVYIGMSIKCGLSYESALRGVTLMPAKLLGIDHHTGSLEVGKDADIAIFDGDPFSNYTKCLHTVIDGKMFSHSI